MEEEAKMILAGDIGGTNTRLALFDAPRKGRGRPTLRAVDRFKNHGERSLADIVERFLREQESARVECACFGVAGPVQDDRVELTNLHWSIDARKLGRRFQIKRISLVNDLVAHAEGTNVLRRSELKSLQAGKAMPGANRAILAPGTGLGEGGLIWDESRKDYRAFPSEGGHSDFAPRDDREDALNRFLRARLHRTVSWEDVLSGPGVAHLYAFLTDPSSGRFRVEAPSQKLTPAQITHAAKLETCPACKAAVDWLVTLYGAEAGNLALKLLARGGVFIGGGIALHIVDLLNSPTLRRAFYEKGPSNIQKLLSEIPIRVILAEDNALYGAAHIATRMIR
jgi:glucokinase